MKFIVILALNSIVLGSGPRLIQKPENTQANVGETGTVLIEFPKTPKPLRLDINNN